MGLRMRMMLLASMAWICARSRSAIIKYIDNIDKEIANAAHERYGNLML